MGTNTSTNRNLASFALVSSIIFIWSASFIFIRIALEEIPPVTLALARFAIAAPILIVPTAYARSSRKAMRIGLSRDFVQFSALALTGVTLLYVFQFYALQLMSATEGSILINLHAIFAMLLSAMFLRDPLTRRKTVGVFLAFAGVIVITMGGASTASLSLFEPVGVLLMVAAAFCWAVYSILGKKVLQGYSSAVATSCVFLLGTLYLVPFALVEGRTGLLLNSSWPTWFSIVYLAIPSSVIAYMLWNRAIKEIDVTKVLVSMYAIPIPTAILSYLFLGEMMTYFLVLGGALVIIGVYLTESSRSNHQA